MFGKAGIAESHWPLHPGIGKMIKIESGERLTISSTTLPTMSPLVRSKSSRLFPACAPSGRNNHDVRAGGLFVAIGPIKRTSKPSIGAASAKVQGFALRHAFDDILPGQRRPVPLRQPVRAVAPNIARADTVIFFVLPISSILLDVRRTFSLSRPRPENLG